MNSVREKSERVVVEWLNANGLRLNALTDVSVDRVREAMRGAVPGMRVTHLAPSLASEFLQAPLTRDLLCLRAGFHEAPRTHYLPRPFGSVDTIVIFCSRGRGWLELDGVTYTVESGCGFVIPRNRPHTYGADPDDPWACYWVHFQGEQADRYTELMYSDGANPVFYIPLPDELIAAYEQTYQYMNCVHTHATMLAAAGALSQLLGEVNLQMRSIEARSRTANDSLERSVDYMNRNIINRLSLVELAAVAGMSPNHYATMFRRRFSYAPINYFNQLKVQQACQLLVTTDLRISEIAEQLGFSDPYYFSRLFKKVMGVAPKSYQ